MRKPMLCAGLATSSKTLALVHGHRAAWLLLFVATLLPPLPAQSQAKPTSTEAQAAAAQWLHALGPNGLVLHHRLPDPAPSGGYGAERGFLASQNTSPYWKGKQTTLVLEEPGWSIRLGFNGELSARSPRRTVQRLFSYLVLERLPTPGLALSGWEVRPLTPSSHVVQGVEILHYGNGRISLRVRTRFFALSGQDPAAISHLPADAAAPPSAYFQIRQPFPLDLTLEAPLLFQSDENRRERPGRS
jgi:hypothetical protein